ncbi:MAG: hypothetical protein U0625_04310 [Phycisphaerales bacterium]
MNQTLAASIAIATLTTAASAGIAPAVLDVFLSAEDGRVLTSGFSDETKSVVAPGQRVFAAVLGEDPEFPFSGDEPGIRGDLVDVTVSFTLQSGLWRWNGAGFDATGGALLVEYGGSVVDSLTGGSIAYFANADTHVHPGYTLAGPEGADPATGIYLAAFNASATGLRTSETFWMVFNLGEGDGEHAAAMAWAQENLVPAPGALALLGLAPIIGRRARSRSSRRSSAARP